MVGKMEAIMLLLSRRSNFTRRKMKSRLMPNTWGANIMELLRVGVGGWSYGVLTLVIVFLVM